MAPRPLKACEKNLTVPVEVHQDVHKIFLREVGTDKSIVKSYSFDKVFGPDTKQEDIYREVVTPVMEQVIMGFNCTIFAYGQTGTGKTFTIEGGRSSNRKGRSEDPLDGIIPRSMMHLFNELNGKNVQFEINVTFLELYNEEIFDLLSSSDVPTKLKIFDNSEQKGSVIVQGLQIMPVKSMKDVYSVLDKGSKRRRTAATILNKVSSRSHTIFTVAVKIKESSSMLENVKHGKLNLVDLAGSENIGRSGAIEKRAREAGNINQSLLALGRVITSLCEKAGHIPYRESKLTRLLQDSLGGQTKTTIIATISPSIVHVEETSNTLEYALRAKSITNRPELNTQVTMNSLAKDYLEEIKRLNESIYDVGRLKGFHIPEGRIRQWESTVASAREEQYKLLAEIEALEEEERALDAALIEAENVELENESRLHKVKQDEEELLKRLAKEQADYRFHQEMLKVMQPIEECIHEDLHKSFEKLQELRTEIKKNNDKLSAVVSEKEMAFKMLRAIQKKNKELNENFHHYSSNLMNNVKNINYTVNSMASECNDCISVLKDGFETRTTDCENEFRNIFKATSELEAISNSFQVNVEAALQEEKSAHLNWIENFESTCTSSNETSLLQPLDNTLSECKTSLLSLSTSFCDWKDDMVSEMNVFNKRMEEHLDRQKSVLDSTTVTMNTLLEILKENIEDYGSFISESLNSEVANKKLWEEKFLNVEQALLSLDTFSNEYINDGVDNSIQAENMSKRCSNASKDITRKLTDFSDCFMEDVDTMQKEFDCHVQNYSSEKWEETKANAYSLSSRYKDFNSELVKFSSTSENFDGFFYTEVEGLSQFKVKTNEESKVSDCIQEMSESIRKVGHTYKSFLFEKQAEIDQSLLKDKMQCEKLTESSKQLANTLHSKLSSYVRSLETDVLSISRESSDEMNNTTAEETKLQSTLLQAEQTLPFVNSSKDGTFGNISKDGPSESSSRDGTFVGDVVDETECPICSKRNKAEPLHTGSLSVSHFNKRSNSYLELTQAASEASDLSFMPAVPGPSMQRATTDLFVGHDCGTPEVRRASELRHASVRKRLTFTDAEKLARQVLELTSDEEEE